MATSGTATFTLNFDQMLTVASAYTGGEDVTGFDAQQAQVIMNLMMADMATRGVNMWAMDRQYIDVLPGVGRYQLPADTIDVLEMVTRTFPNQGNPRLIETIMSPYSTTFGSPIVTVAFEDHGATMGDTVAITPSATVGGISIPAGNYVITSTPTFNTFTITPGPAATSTVTGQGGAITFTFIVGTDVPVTRIARDVYQQQANKFVLGRPTMAFIDRQTQPVMNLFPVPQQGQCDQVLYYRKRRIQDISGATQTLDLPIYMQPAITWGLAYQFSMIRANVAPDRIAMLRGNYLEAIRRAIDEDRDSSAFYTAPDLTGLFVR